MKSDFRIVRVEDKTLVILDQTILPERLVYHRYVDYRDVIEAIRRLEVRGAPAIGIAAAYAVALAAEAKVDIGLDGLRSLMVDVGKEIKKVRPTAVNLAWAVDRVLISGNKYNGQSIDEYRAVLWKEADTILEEDRVMCLAIGQNGAKLLPEKCSILTHCNAGALATGGSGTALAVIYKACEMGKKIKVYAGETRPLLQGARLTCWELMNNEIDVTLITDSMAGYIMAQGMIDVVIVGADRIAANGDVANKIGTYSLAVLAKTHNLPFYVAAPRSTFDNQIESGRSISIEERSSEEITDYFGKRTAPANVQVFNPAFDITPAELITAYITDFGVRPGRRT